MVLKMEPKMERMNRITKEPFYARAAYIGTCARMVKTAGRILQRFAAVQSGIAPLPLKGCTARPNRQQSVNTPNF